MDVTNYGELKTALAGYIHRTDLEDMIETFIRMAQVRISRDLDDNALETSGTVSVTAGTKTASIPTGLIQTYHIQVSSGSTAYMLRQDTLLGVENRNASEVSGVPTHYARNGNQFIFAPTPDADGSYPIYYKKRLTAFSADVDTDDILTDYPNIYIYASMIESAPYLRDGTFVKTWKELYTEEVRAINDQAYEAKFLGPPAQVNSSLGVSTR